MPLEKVFIIMDKIKEKAVELQMYDSSQTFAQPGFFSNESLTEFLSKSDSEAPDDDIPSLRSKLIYALLDLSPQEAQELLAKTKGTKYEQILAQTTNSARLPMRIKFKVVKLFWNNYDIVGKTVDVGLRKIRERQPDRNLEGDELQEFYRAKEKGTAVFLAIKELAKLKMVDDDFAPIILDSLALKDTSDIELLSEVLTDKIIDSDNPKALKQLAIIWQRLAPSTIERKLGQVLFLSSYSTKAKENAKHALVLMEKDPLSIVEGTQIMGDNINLNGDYRGANVPIKSTLNGVTSSINNNSDFDDSTKKALDDLIKHLDDTSKFYPPAGLQKILDAEEKLGIKLPDELISALQETNGITANYGAWLVWPIERIIEDNLMFRSNGDFSKLYMPFDHLLFIGEAGNGDQFAYGIVGGEILNTDIYLWDHEMDSREWFAASLKDYVQKWLSK